ncbi:MAG: radical SAM/SPASM domain-containing protein [Planctomycetota bacterium]
MDELARRWERTRVHAIGALIKSMEWAAGRPLLRHLLLRVIQGRIRASYEGLDRDPTELMYLKWFGAHLDAFLERLMAERPAAARAILRFVGTWIQDMYRRNIDFADHPVTPTTVVIEPTDRCNLNCPGCYAKSTRDGADVPYDRLVEIVEQVIDMGVTLITVSGGEPFLREREDRALTRLARRFDDRGFLVYTNGTLIDADVAKQLADVGNVFPAISVEGSEHQTDARRGKGMYARSRRARGHLADAGVMTGFSATVTRQNADAITDDAFIDLRIEEGDLFGWFFLLQPIGRSPRLDLMPTAEQRAGLRSAIDRWREQHRPIFLGDFWNDGHLVGGCIAGGRSYFHIYANGDVSPCVFSPVACGNVFDIIEGRSDYESLADFVSRHPAFVAFRREQARITDRARPCLLIDHPDAFRRVCRSGPWRPAKNMPDGYLDGAIARHMDRCAADWKWQVAEMPPLAALREQREHGQPMRARAGA